MNPALPRRLVSAGAVLALHLAVLSLFLIASYTRMQVGHVAREIEINFPAFAPKAAPPFPALQPNLVAPVAPRSPTLPALPPAAGAAPAPAAPGNLSGVGRALFGCDAMKLDTLSPEDRANCQRLAPGKPPVQSVRLGPPPDPNSPFTKEIEERFREAEPINRPCPLGSYNDTHGLPCFGFSHEAPLFSRPQ